MGKATLCVQINPLTWENSKILNFMEKALSPLRVKLIVLLDNTLTVFHNINLTNICSKLLLQKKKKMIQKQLVKKMPKKVVLQLMKQKELVTL